MNLLNLPAIQCHVLPDRFRRQKRPRPPRCRRKFVQLASQPALQPQRKDFLACHRCLPTTSAYIVFVLMSQGKPDAPLSRARPPYCVGPRFSATTNLSFLSPCRGATPRARLTPLRGYSSVYSVPLRLCVLYVNSFFSSTCAAFPVRKYYASHSNLVPHRNNI